jgi:hypothetical protein
VKFLHKAPIHLSIFCLTGILGVANALAAASNSKARDLTYGSPAAPFFYVMHTEATFDRPKAQVWSAFNDMRRWYTEYKWEDLSGPSYESSGGLAQGQVLELTFADAAKKKPRGHGSTPQQYIMKTIEVVPGKEIVIVLWGEAFDWKQYTVFYVWKLVEKGLQTTVTVDSYGEAELMKPLSQAEFASYQEDFTKNWHRSWDEAFSSLKRLLTSHQ